MPTIPLLLRRTVGAYIRICSLEHRRNSTDGG